MHLCGICIENVESPVALPCGHIFCAECLSRAVNAIKSYSTLHCCPTCRSRYSVAGIDPVLTPLSPPHVIPSIRRLYLDQRAPPAPISSVTEIAKENRRLLAENSALRTNCEMWRKRAETHSAATLNLLGLLRTARDQAIQLHHEQHNVLKRKSDEDELSDCFAEHPSSANDRLSADCPHEGSMLNFPVALVQASSSSLLPKDVASALKSALVRPAKRVERWLRHYDRYLSTVAELRKCPNSPPRMVIMNSCKHDHDKVQDVLVPGRILAGYPFNHPNADVILRSSGDKPVDFFVFKLLLTLASPFFELLLSLPQPQQTTIHDIPVIQMAEDKDTLKLVLGFCLPISMAESPRLSSLHELQMVLKAAIKLEMEGIQRYVRRELLEPRFIESQPLRVFAIACHYGWLAEAKKAARFTLRHPVNTSLIDELDLITAATYYRLQEYHRECGEIAASRTVLLARRPAMDDDWVWLRCLTCNRAASYSWWRKDNPSSPAVPKWWVDWMDSVARQLRRIPWGETVKKWDLMNTAIIRAKDCSYCGKKAEGDLEAFSRIIAVDIEKHISMVTMDLGDSEHEGHSSEDNETDWRSCE